jgi:hypothetical protein
MDMQEFTPIDEDKMNACVDTILKEIKETFPRVDTVIRRFKHFLQRGDWDDAILDDLVDRVIRELKDYYSRDVDVTWSFDYSCLYNHKSGGRYYVEVNSLYVAKHFGGPAQKQDLVWIEEYLRDIANEICNTGTNVDGIAESIRELTGSLEYNAKKARKRGKNN